MSARQVTLAQVTRERDEAREKAEWWREEARKVFDDCPLTPEAWRAAYPFPWEVA